jgi:ABC transporter DrrB family efflux protein
MSSTTESFPSDQVMTSKTEIQTGIGWLLTDSILLGQRNLKRILRSPDLIFYALFMPLVFMFLFVYVFGGAIHVPGMSYRQFLLPGLFVQMVIFGSVSATAIGVAEDMQRGIMDRFRSLPMTTSSVLMGRQITEILRNVITIAVMVVAGLLIGFRFRGTLAETLAGFGLLLLFGFAFSWLAAFIGLSVGSAQAAQSAGLVWLFPFVFLSSAFVPTQTMPIWLRVFAERSPITAIVNTLRAWFDGQSAGAAPWMALAWALGLIAVFMPLSIARFNRGEA